MVFTSSNFRLLKIGHLISNFIFLASKLTVGKSKHLWESIQLFYTTALRELELVYENPCFSTQTKPTTTSYHLFCLRRHSLRYLCEMKPIQNFSPIGLSGFKQHIASTTDKTEGSLESWLEAINFNLAFCYIRSLFDTDTVRSDD